MRSGECDDQKTRFTTVDSTGHLRIDQRVEGGNKRILKNSCVVSPTTFYVSIEYSHEGPFRRTSMSLQTVSEILPFPREY